MEPRTGAELIAGYKAAHGRINGAGVEYQTRGSNEKKLRDEVERLMCLNEDLHQTIRDQKLTIARQGAALRNLGFSPRLAEDACIPTIDRIIRAVSIRSSLSPAELRGISRRKNICYWRNLIVIIALKHIGCSTVVVGRALGDRDHTTIMNNRDKGLKHCKQEDFASIEASLGLTTAIREAGE